MTRELYLDAAVGIYAIGAASPAKASCIRLVERAAEGELTLHASVETIQEFCLHRMRRTGRSAAVAEAEHLSSLVVLHDFDRVVLDQSLRLIETTSVRGRDAVHAATALVHGLTQIVSPDHAFDGVPGLTRLDPADA